MGEKKREWLKDIRKNKGLSVIQAAKLVNISTSYFTNIELGTRTPSLDVAFRIAKELSFDVEKFGCED